MQSVFWLCAGTSSVWRQQAPQALRHSSSGSSSIRQGGRQQGAEQAQLQQLAGLQQTAAAGAALSSIVQMPASMAGDVRANTADASSAREPSTAMAKEPPAAVAPSAALAGKAPQAIAKPEVEDASVPASAASSSSTGT